MRNDQHDNERLTWLAASAADIDAYYGERPRQTMKALVIKKGERPVAIIGMVMDKQIMRAFSESVPELEPHLRSMTVLRAIKAAQQMFSESARPVFAVRGSDSRILERLGFIPVDSDLYRWKGV